MYAPISTSLNFHQERVLQYNCSAHCGSEDENEYDEAGDKAWLAPGERLPPAEVMSRTSSRINSTNSGRLCWAVGRFLGILVVFVFFVYLVDFLVVKIRTGDDSHSLDISPKHLVTSRDICPFNGKTPTTKSRFPHIRIPRLPGFGGKTDEKDSSSKANEEESSKNNLQLQATSSMLKMPGFHIPKFGDQSDAESTSEEVLHPVCGGQVATLWKTRGSEFYYAVLDCVGLLGLCTTNCLTQCLQKKYPEIPDSCAQCFEVGAVCGKAHCWQACVFYGKESIQCRNCAEGECGGSSHTSPNFYETYVASLRNDGCNSHFYDIFQGSQEQRDSGYAIPHDMQTCTGVVFDVLVNIVPNHA